MSSTVPDRAAMDRTVVGRTFHRHCNRSLWLSSSLLLCLIVGSSDGVDAAAPQAGTPQAGTPQAGTSPPNIVVILADDLGYGDVRCNNPERGKIATPHIDRLAAQGMRFTDGHSSSGVCSPSRYTLLTGRYHWRTRLQSGIVGVFGSPLIAPDRLTIAGLAKRRGYQTACVGKWHLGRDWPVDERERQALAAPKDGPAAANDSLRATWREIFSRPIPGGPTTRGFDLYFGTDVPNWPPYCFIENDRTQGLPSEFLPAELLKDHQASIQGPALPDWKLEAILPALGDRAVQFIQQNAAAKKSFLLYMPLTSPHTPLSVNDAWKGQSGLGPFADLVMETDAVVGRVLEALETSGVADQTLVVFTADNGCAPYIGVKGLEAAGHFPSGPFRGYKADVWEGGHRVPFVIRWPGVVRPGSVCDQLVHHADFMATFADIWAEPLPDNAGEDSFSLMPLLKGGATPVRANAVSCSAGGVPGLRSGSWKYIPHHGSGVRAPANEASAAIQLYDLATDPGESKNLATEQPERVAAMRDLLEKLIVDGRSRPGPKQSNDVRVRRFPVDSPPAKGKKKS